MLLPLLAASLAPVVVGLRGMAASFASMPDQASPLNWDEIGCFHLSADDRAEAMHPFKTIHDSHCVSWRAFDSKCRSGLPFYRFPNLPGCVDCLDEDQCKLKCLSKGMDVAGLFGSTECRCGASVLNKPIWRSIVETSEADGLQSVFYLLPPDQAEATPSSAKCEVRVFQYADKREVDGAPPRALMSLSSIDDAYVQSIVSGTEATAEVEDSAPEDFDRVHESINKRLHLWQSQLASNKLKRKTLFTELQKPKTMVELEDRSSTLSESCSGVKEDKSVCWDQAVLDTNCGEYCTAKDFERFRSSWCTPERASKCPMTCGRCRLFDRQPADAAAVPLWPSRILKYYFDDQNKHMTPERKETFRAALGFWASKTCLSFEELRVAPPEDSKEPYVFVSVLLGATGQPSGCSCAPVGYPGEGEKTVVNMGSCADMSKVGSVVHELGHLLGLAHTQMRPDRDDYIRVLWENIQPRFKKNFKIEPYEFVGANGKYSPYDINSIMHYTPTQGMIPELYDPIKNPGTFSVMAPVPSGVVIGQRKSLTDLDIAAINTLYRCKYSPTENSSSSTPSSSSVVPSVSAAPSAAVPSTSAAPPASAHQTALSGSKFDPNASWQEIIQKIAEAIEAIVHEGVTTEVNSLTESEVENLLMVTQLAQILVDKFEDFELSSKMISAK